jgi:N-acetyl-anhydromuramyl-L-alanine amidase AmpD
VSKQSNRRVVVFISLVGVLSLTSALLLALAPSPLTPDASSSLFAIESPDSLDVVFQTQVATQKGQWKYIFIHHSRSASGDANSLSHRSTGLSDHFVIGNGFGAVDGEIQIGQRWTQQQPALPPAGATGINQACISICLVGDLDRSRPSPIQLRRLSQLVTALQTRFDIPAGQVLLMDQRASAAGIGQMFPTSAFRDTLMP